eukprot:COSAG06_NODE_5194_length_3646_cov_7.440372_5_plen_61_part_00
MTIQHAATCCCYHVCSTTTTIPLMHKSLCCALCLSGLYDDLQHAQVADTSSMGAYIYMNE